MWLVLLAACGGSSAPEIGVPGVKSTLPEGMVPVSDAVAAVLTDGALRNDPDADVAVRAVADPKSPDQILYAVLRIHRSPGLDGGMTVEEWARANISALQDHGKVTRQQVSHHLSCADQACVLDYALGEVHRRSRFSHEGGRLLTLSCQCTGADCLDTCSLKPPSK